MRSALAAPLRLRALQPLIGNQAVMRVYLAHAVTPVQGTGERVQRGFEDVLKGEAEVRAGKLLAGAVVARRERDQMNKRIQHEQTEKQPGYEERITQFTGRKERAFERYNHAFKVLNVWYMAATDGKKLKHEDLEFDGLAEHHPLRADFETGAKTMYLKEGKRQFDRASKQVELLLGSRQEVAETKESQKYLDTNIWSWGVNQAFVEGGAQKQARFVIHSDIGEHAMGLLARPRMTGREFLEAIRPTEERHEGLHRNLWHSRDGRPTWYALELAGLLDLGYRLRDRRTLVPPERMGTISKETGEMGKTTYLITEGLVKQLA